MNDTDTENDPRAADLNAAYNDGWDGALLQAAEIVNRCVADSHVASSAITLAGQRYLVQEIGTLRHYDKPWTQTDDVRRIATAIAERVFDSPEARDRMRDLLVEFAEEIKRQAIEP